MRRFAVQSLGQAGRGDKAAICLKTLVKAREGDKDEEVRTQARAALDAVLASKSGDASYLREVAGDTMNPPDVRKAAIEAIGKMDPKDRGEARRQLLDWLKDKDIKISNAAVDALTGVELNETHETTLKELLSRGETPDKVREFAVRRLGKMGITMPGLPGLPGIPKGGEGKPGMRRAVVEVLRDKPTLSREECRVLEGLLEDADQDVRSKAAEALDKRDLGSHTLGAFLKALESDDPKVRGVGRGHLLPADNLERGGDPEEVAFLSHVFVDIKPYQRFLGADDVATLRTALASRKPLVRKFAAFALGVIGPSARDAVPDLTKALGDQSLPVRTEVLASLAMIGTEAREVVPELMKTMKSANNPIERCSVALALVKCGGDPKDAVPVLVSGLKDASGLGKFGRTQVLRKFLKETLIKDVGRLALDQLVKALNGGFDGDILALLSAIEVVGEVATVGDFEAMKALDRLAHRSQPLEIRQPAIGAKAKIQKKQESK